MGTERAAARACSRAAQLSGALLALLLAVLTITQAADHISGFQSETPSAKAKAWQRRVATDLRLEQGKVWAATFVWRSSKPTYAKRTGLKVRAWQLRFKNLDARRLWFETNEAALTYAAEVTAQRANKYVVLEVRGKQVVIASGSRVQRIDDAGRVLVSLWREAPAKQPTALLTVRYGSEALSGWTVNRGPFHKRIVSGLKRAKRPPSGVTAKWANQASVELIAKDHSTYLTLEPGSGMYIHAQGPKHRHRSFRVDEFLEGLRNFQKIRPDRSKKTRRSMRIRRVLRKTGATSRPSRARPRRVR